MQVSAVIRECGRDGTPSSTHQYKFPDNFSTNPTSEGSLLPVQSIKFEVYNHFSGISFIAEVSFWRPLKTVVSHELFIIIKRVSGASGASEAFSLVMKTNNCLRLCALTRNACLHRRTCPHLAYTCPQLVYVSSPGDYVFASNRHASLSTNPSPSKNYAPTIPCSSPLKALTETVVWTDATMPCLSKAFQ